MFAGQMFAAGIHQFNKKAPAGHYLKPVAKGNSRLPFLDMG
jgi:hypothetical protein